MHLSSEKSKEAEMNVPNGIVVPNSHKEESVTDPCIVTSSVPKLTCGIFIIKDRKFSGNTEKKGARQRLIARGGSVVTSSWMIPAKWPQVKP